ncbi:MAG: hypothetical protein QOF36_2614 [Microbacteriaceae bacterium]|jgi:hypothetical protein|nr:hypothetical protein [Microbacteriaceae bacterium]
MDYEEAARLHAKAKRPDAGKPIARNTRIMRLDGHDPSDTAYAIRFHATNVVTFYPDGMLTFYTGGWETISTADRMSMASGVRAFARVARGSGESAIFVKLGDDWRTGYGECVRANPRATLNSDGEWIEHDETYGEFEARRAEEANERARERRVERHEQALDVIVGNPRGRWGWNHITAGHVRVENGVIFSGQHPVAVCYPHPDEGVQANVLTVSQRAVKRTRVGLELVERASEAGHRLVFAPHEVVIEETQNRRHA